MPVANKLRTDRGGSRDLAPWRVQGSALVGFGAKPQGLAHRGGARKPKERQSLAPISRAVQKQSSAPPKKPSRANPLSWEIKDFPSHGEPQTVFRSVGPERFRPEAAAQEGERCPGKQPRLRKQPRPQISSPQPPRRQISARFAKIRQNPLAISRGGCYNMVPVNWTAFIIPSKQAGPWRISVFRGLFLARVARGRG